MSRINTQIHSYWSRQLSELKKEGWVAARRKTVTVILKLLKSPFDLVGFTLAVPVVLFVRLIKPIKLIRFGYFFTNRIGHFCFDVEYYLTEKKLGLQPKKATDLFYLYGKPANDYFTKLTKKNLKINSFVKYLYKWNDWFPSGEAHQLLPAMRRFGSRDIRGLFQKTGPQLKFAKLETRQGRNFIKEIGLKDADKFICLNVRDSAYLKTPNDIFNYHNYRDSDIDTYKEAALSLADKGYWVFRMGKTVHKAFNVDHPRIFDYANSEFRSDFLDIWLMANCCFTITTSTGLDNVAVIFRRPILCVNHLPVGDCRTGSNDLTEYFKIMKWRKDGKYLSLKEQIDTGAIRFFKKNDYDRLGIKIIDNTSTSIKNAVLDFERKLISKDNENECSVLQKKFWDIMKEYKDFSKYHGKYRPKISSVFIEEHHEWFLA